MFQQWTFGRKIGAGYTFGSIAILIIGLVGTRSIQGLIGTDLKVSHSRQVRREIAAFSSLIMDAESGQRGFVITGLDAFLEPYTQGKDQIPIQWSRLTEITRDDPEQQQRLERLKPLVDQKMVELKLRVDQRRNEGFEPTARMIAQGKGRRLMDEIRTILTEMDDAEERYVVLRSEESTAQAAFATGFIFWSCIITVLLKILIGTSITTSVATQVSTSVGQIQSSSVELEATANQQTTAARGQATAMNEITTTITELLATSRQIAESAQRVAQTSQETATAAGTGEHTVEESQRSIAGIRRQVDLVVGHMLELEQKSQQIGSVLNLVGDLADQTNILAINATIEAAGAGESGRRFAVVADEVRSLADRVSGSTKEIRALIEDIRSAVNRTVMATETSSKAVTAGTKHFEDVSQAFKQIVTLVTVTTEAAQEIGLSTKQQATAVEQVTVAIGEVAQATRETESSSTQALQTASQLARLSNELQRAVDPQANQLLHRVSNARSPGP